MGSGVDGLRVEGGIAPSVDGDLAQLLTGEAELVHPARAHHGDPVGGRDGAVGQCPLHEAAEAWHRAPAPRTADATGAPARASLGAALAHGAVDEDMPGQPRRDGQRGGDDGAHLRGALAPAVVPVQGQAQGVLDLRRGRAGESGRPRPHAGIRREPVDVVAGQPGVGDGGQARLHRQVEVGATKPASHIRLPDSRDDGLALQRLPGRSRAHDASAGVKSGSQTSSTCSNSTRTGMPMRTSSGSASTRFVVRRMSGCSSIETQAMM